MEPFTVQLQQGNEETIECWDDDDDLQCNEDIQFRTASSATSVTNCSIRRSGHRDSISSRRSARSDLDSNAGGDEDWQVQLLENDDVANEEAITSAKKAGIPLPSNVPKSALIGGTIKRLGRKNPRKNSADDWSEDVEFPDSENMLKLKDPKERAFPETLRQINSAINSTATSPVKTSASPSWDTDISGCLQSALTRLEIFRDENDITDSQDVPTIKVPKARPSQQTTPVNINPRSDKVENEIENFDGDFELPAGNLPLKLSSRKPNAENSSPFSEDLDLDWSEGSIGVRFGGTARDRRRSNPSSSVSIASPSVSSCLTGESENDGLDGLIIPEEPLDLETSLKKRQDSGSTAVQPQPVSDQNGREPPADADDFFSGIEIEDNNAFTPGKLSLNPNVKCKSELLGSPARRSATTITFTNTSVSPKTRIPRLSGHDRSHSTHLETVSESGAPLSTFRRSQSRIGGHSSHSSVSNQPISAAASASPTPSPSRRLVGTRLPKDSLTSGRVPAGKQLLKTKRSMPTMRGIYQGASSTQTHGPLAYADSTSQPFVSTTLPKAPVDHLASESKPPHRRTQAPFIPAGASGNQSHHATVKSHRHARRANSDNSGDIFQSHRPVSRLVRLNRTDHLDNNSLNDASPGAVASKRTLTKPAHRRNFGDGTELESFDDLPTSSSAESKFVKYPTGRGAPRSLRSRFNQGQTMLPRVETPTQPPTPVAAPASTPRFARDTNASRNAREQRIASMKLNLKSRETNSLPSLNANWKSQTTSRLPSSSATLKNKKGRSTAPGTKPHLIKPMGVGVQEAKCKLMQVITIGDILCQSANLPPLAPFLSR